MNRVESGPVLMALRQDIAAFIKDRGKWPTAIEFSPRSHDAVMDDPGILSVFGPRIDGPNTICGIPFVTDQSVSVGWRLQE
jgi:hypothetical protein